MPHLARSPQLQLLDRLFRLMRHDVVAPIADAVQVRTGWWCRCGGRVEGAMHVCGGVEVRTQIQCRRGEDGESWRFRHP